jgi:hypothetical protein
MEISKNSLTTFQMEIIIVNLSKHQIINDMKNILVILSLMLMLPLVSCNSTREVSERRSLMIPRTSEIPRNRAKFKEMDYSRRYKYQAKKSKERIRYTAENRK